MKKTTKKNSAMKKMIPALGMLMVSASMLATSTYAWFTMSDTVSVTGMKLKATASDGLLITDTNVAADRVWATSKDIQMTSGVALSPTNTADGSEWVAAKSANFDNADKDQDAAGYTTICAPSANSAVNFTYTNPASNGSHWITGEGVGSQTISSVEANYVLLKNFWVKSSGDADWSKDLTVESVTATIGTTNLTGEENADARAKEANLYKSLRVLIVVGNESFIYAPITTDDNAVKFKGTGNALTLKANNAQSVFAAVNTIPIADSSAVNVKMYMYFDGEDLNCKTSNVSGISLNDVTVSAVFGTIDNT
jgi:hypothetical protein